MNTPTIEVEDTTTRKWVVYLNDEEIEKIVLDWFERETKIPKGVDPQLNWNGRVPSVTITAQQVVDNRPQPMEG